MGESPYGEPVSTAAELATLDDDDILEGYRDGLDDAPEPSGNRSKGYWHGWRNGMIDRGRLPVHPAGVALIKDMRRTGPLPRHPHPGAQQHD